MEIKENILLDELENIFVENNQNYVADKECIKDDEFLKIVAVEKGQALGYATLYFGSDFLHCNLTLLVLGIVLLFFPLNFIDMGPPSPFKLMYLFGCAGS